MSMTSLSLSFYYPFSPPSVLPFLDFFYFSTRILIFLCLIWGFALVNLLSLLMPLLVWCLVWIPTFSFHFFMCFCFQDSIFMSCLVWFYTCLRVCMTYRLRVRQPTNVCFRIDCLCHANTGCLVHRAALS